MRVLVTGHDGYIGSVARAAAPGARARGGRPRQRTCSSGCTFGAEPAADARRSRKDIRDVDGRRPRGLRRRRPPRRLSNDPLGDLDPEITYDINHRGDGARSPSWRRRPASALRLLVVVQPLRRRTATTSSTRRADFNPVTPYGESKVLAEQRPRARSPTTTSARRSCATPPPTASRPRLRGDLVVNNLVGLRGHRPARCCMKSDGTPWRPLVHIEDIAARLPRGARGAARARPQRGLQRRRAPTENYQIRDVAEIVERRRAGQPRSRFADGAGPDMRNYRVNCDKIAATLPGVPAAAGRCARGVEELYDAYRAARPRRSSELDGHALHAHRARQGAASTSGALDRAWPTCAGRADAADLDAATDALTRDRAAAASCGGTDAASRSSPSARRRSPTRSSRRSELDEPEDRVPARRRLLPGLLPGADPRGGAAGEAVRRQLPLLLVVLRRSCSRHCARARARA